MILVGAFQGSFRGSTEVPDRADNELAVKCGLANPKPNQLVLARIVGSLVNAPSKDAPRKPNTP